VPPGCRSATCWRTRAMRTAEPILCAADAGARGEPGSWTCTHLTAARRATFAGAILHNGNLYCPATPKALFELGHWLVTASLALVETHDKMTAELSCYKLGRITSNDADGYHRVSCPAVMAKLPLSASQGLDGALLQQAQIICPPDPAPKCVCKEHPQCPERQRQDRAEARLPSQAPRRSYARRTAVERSNSRVKTGHHRRLKGLCRIMGSCRSACSSLVPSSCATSPSRCLHRARTRRAEAKSRPGSREDEKRRRRSLSDLAGDDGSACP